MCRSGPRGGASELVSVGQRRRRDLSETGETRSAFVGSAPSSGGYLDVAWSSSASIAASGIRTVTQGGITSRLQSAAGSTTGGSQPIALPYGQNIRWLRYLATSRASDLRCSPTELAQHNCLGFTGRRRARSLPPRSPAMGLRRCATPTPTMPSRRLRCPMVRSYSSPSPPQNFTARSQTPGVSHKRHRYSTTVPAGAQRRSLIQSVHLRISLPHVSACP